MYEYIVERFAGLLTKGDVMELFKLLERRYATIARVCERVGIERKTFYNWRTVREISPETKAKILRAALEEYMLDVLEFLAIKSRERCVEILSITIEHLRREMLAEESPQRLRELVKATERLLNNFSAPITDFLTQEMSALMETATWKGQQITLTEPQTLYTTRKTTIEVLEELEKISKKIHAYTTTTSNLATLFREDILLKAGSL